ncbi:unnamed protein product [marine sediment metagenome]|uniref:Uncharacterized protein n=1 Tax=marine sediment metagenome TaxID=412755 RepID=X1T4M0_9ZZZZ
MAHENTGNYSAKHPPEKKLNPKIAEVVKLQALDGKISCASGHKITGNLNVPPAEVGITIDLLEMRINRCQLGLYGYSPEKRIVKPADKVSPELEKTILKTLANDRLSCAAAWEIAKNFNIPKMEVSSACEALKIKISSCQLGAF